MAAETVRPMERAGGPTRRSMYLRMVLRSLSRRRSRVLIALLAVSIGATTLTGLANVHADLSRQMGRELRSYGANLVVVPDGRATLDDSILPALDAAVSDQSVVGRVAFRYETVKVNARPLTVAGTDLDDVMAVRPYWQVTGSLPGTGSVLLGRDIVDIVGLEPGDTITMVAIGAVGIDAELQATVSGVLDTGGPEDAFIVMDRASLDGVFGDAGSIDVIEYSIATEGGALQAIASRLSDPDGGVAASPVKRLVRSETAVLSTLSALLLLVTVIVLALTMITVGTTMVAVVTERRSEIGLRKALGASNRSIIGEFLGEGLLLGAVGGLIGGGLGLVFAQVVSLSVFSRGIAADWTLVPTAVVASLLVAGVACLIPVRRATDIEPAIVLREE